MKSGNIFDSNNFGKFEVMEYINSFNVVIKFIDTGFVTISEAGAIRNGQVKDLLVPVVYGVGYMGVGDYKSSIKRKPTEAYMSWKRMLARCYCPKNQNRSPTYIGCIVSDDWHNFQNFAKWFDKNYIVGYHLDKDIKVEGNKIYSESTCMFVSGEENRRHAKLG
jgi:hypothetical protein